MTSHNFSLVTRLVQGPRRQNRNVVSRSAKSFRRGLVLVTPSSEVPSSTKEVERKRRKRWRETGKKGEKLEGEGNEGMKQWKKKVGRE